MFTGIITHTAAVLQHTRVDSGLVITFDRPSAWTDLALGESVSTNGACLTVAALRPGEYDCHLMAETLAKTTFGERVPDMVNLERALSASERFGGHFVQGHVDEVGTVSAIDKSAGHVLTVEFSPNSAPLVVPKGSICIDGVSLTVAATKAHTLSVALIPHTLEHTTLHSLGVGDKVNLEFDMLGKYIVKYLETSYSHAKS